MSELHGKIKRVEDRRRFIRVARVLGTAPSLASRGATLFEVELVCGHRATVIQQRAPVRARCNVCRHPLEGDI